jgi:feruloyl-CoA synthase
VNIRELIEHNARTHPEKIYLSFEDHKISYREFNDNINRVANGLINLGIQKGDRVCLMQFNSPEFLY